MGRGRAKSTGLGVIKWTCKAIFCSTALIALVVGYSIVGAFLFQAVENSDSVRNSQISLDSREEYIKTLDNLLQELCEQLRQNYLDSLIQNDTEDIDYEDYNSTTNSTMNETWTTQIPPETTTEVNLLNLSLPASCYNGSQILNDRLLGYEQNLTMHQGWRFDFRDKDRDRTQWTFAEALLYSVTIMTTIGYGNLVPKTTWGRIATMFYAMLGIPLMLFCLAYIGNIWANVLRIIYTGFYRCCQRCKKARGRKSGKLSVNDKKSTKNETNGNLDPEMSPPEEEEEEEIPVPAWLASLILVAYIAGGAVLFHIWEGWRYIESIYFCFITFSTIGFGDFVPGDSVSESDPQRAALCAFYILFGLATMSMVISVIQEDVIRVVYKLGNKIGLTKKKPSD